MDINSIDKLIKDNKFEAFKNELSASVINSHHKNVILGKCFHSGHTEFIEYMFIRATTNSGVIIPFFLEALKKPIEEKNLIFFNQISDEELIPHVNRMVIEDLIKHQNEKVYDWFIHKFPITSFRNFSGIAHHALNTNKENYITPFEGFQFNYKICYFFCLNAFHQDKPELVNKFLVSQIKHNPQIITDIKNHQKELYEKFLIEQQRNAKWRAAAAAVVATTIVKKRKNKTVPIVSTMPSIPTHPTAPATSKVPEPEIINQFMSHQLAKAFSDYLEDKFPKKNDHKIIKRKI